MALTPRPPLPGKPTPALRATPPATGRVISEFDIAGGFCKRQSYKPFPLREGWPEGPGWVCQGAREARGGFASARFAAAPLYHPPP
ncbi:hypothetical protein CCAX7_19290 [Capsulimonas corticalis]|uniref:Uncharacterized protein n=1 Tax=Capsulimonas corticalis TaxID=2219043 RepID=A0A402D578_9BACT|nr:hypothetical protein CCAX7_19290 [Capsulimonas corticalis]